MKLTPDAEVACAVISACGARPLIVGGAVRDHFLGIESKDIDIEVHSDAGVTVDWIELQLRKHGRVDAVGKQFGVLKFRAGVDVSFPRRDSKTGEGHTGFAIEFDSTMTVEEALSRRDFTCNSIAFDTWTQQFIDPFHGREHIEQKLLVHTSAAFADDPLRVLRAVQFAGRLGFTIAEETADLCHELLWTFDQISTERVWGEWEKILTKGKSMRAVVAALHMTGWLEHFPDLDGFNSEIAWTDGLIDVFDSVPRWAGGPERKMAAIVASMFRGTPEACTLFLKSIGAPLWLLRDARKLSQDFGAAWTHGQRAQLRTIARALSPLRLDDWLLVHQLHRTSCRTVAADEEILEAARPLLLTGDALIAEGFTPGPVFGRLIKLATEQQDIQGWETVEQALAWLRDLDGP